MEHDYKIKYFEKEEKNNISHIDILCCIIIFYNLLIFTIKKLKLF